MWGRGGVGEQWGELCGRAVWGELGELCGRSDGGGAVGGNCVRGGAVWSELWGESFVCGELCGVGCVDGAVWRELCGWSCVEGAVWMELCGWSCVDGAVWMELCGWSCVDGAVWGEVSILVYTRSVTCD